MACRELQHGYPVAVLCHPCSRSGPHFPLDNFSEPSDPRNLCVSGMGASGSPARQEARIRLPGFESAHRPLRRARAIPGARKVAAYIPCMEHTATLESVPDDELLRRLSELLRQSRRVEADLVAHIGEVDARRLYAREASPSMFAHCTQVLHLSEFEAYLRITVARAARQHPVLLERLREGSLHLTAIAKLAPHLTRENCETVLARAAHRTKREVEELIAELAPRPDAPTVVRRLPDRGTGTATHDRSPDRTRTESCRSTADSVWTELSRRHSSAAPPAHPSGLPPSGSTLRRHGPRRVHVSWTQGIQAERRPAVCNRRASSHSPPLATGSSSRPAPGSATSWSGSRPSCARRCPTATWP